MNSTPHPEAGEFLWYLRQGLHLALRDWPSPRLQEFEEHLSACDACAALLSSEAQDELLLQELALEGVPKAPAARRWAYAAVATAVLLLVIGVSGGSSDSSAHGHHDSFVPPLDAGLLLADGDLALESPEP